MSSIALGSPFGGGGGGGGGGAVTPQQVTGLLDGAGKLAPTFRPFEIHELAKGVPLSQIMREEPSLFTGATFESNGGRILQQMFRWSATRQKPVQHLEPSLFRVDSPVLNAAGTAPDTDWDGTGVATETAERYVLLIENGMEVYFGPRTRIEALTTSSGAAPGFQGMLMGRRNTQAVTNRALAPTFKIVGGNIGKAGTRSGNFYTGGLRGNIVCVVGGPGSLIKDLCIENFGGGRAYQIAGYDWMIDGGHYLFPTSAPGSGGSRLYFGENVLIRHLFGRSHDDGAQLCQDGRAGSPWAANRIIKNCWYEDFSGQATGSRLVVVLIPENGDGAYAARTIGSGVRRVTGVGPSGALLGFRCEGGGLPTDAEPAMDGILIEGLWGEQVADDEISRRKAFDIQGGCAANGRIGRATIRNCGLIGQPNRHALYTSGKIDHLTIKNFHGGDGPPRDPFDEAVILGGADTLIIDGMTCWAATTGGSQVHGVTLGEPADRQVGTDNYYGANQGNETQPGGGGDGQGPGGTGFDGFDFAGAVIPIRTEIGRYEIDALEVRGVPNNRFALIIPRTRQGGRLNGFRQTAATGATTARAIQLLAAGGPLDIANSDFTAAGNAAPFVLDHGDVQLDRYTLGAPAVLNRLVNRRTRKHGGYEAGERVPLVHEGALAATTGTPPLDTLLITPFTNEGLLLILRLGMRLPTPTAVGSGGVCRIAIWRAGNFTRLGGLPVAGSNAEISTAGTGTPSIEHGSDLNQLLRLPELFVGTVFHVAAPTVNAMAASVGAARRIGAASIAAAISAPNVGWTAGTLARGTDIMTVDGASLTLTAANQTTGFPIVTALLG